MADVRINPQQIVPGGLAVVFTGSLSVSDRYLVNNDGRVILHFKKTGAGACTVTIDTPNTVQGLAIDNPTITVPATTGDKEGGGYSPDLYNQPGTNDLAFTVSEITGLTVAAKRL